MVGFFVILLASFLIIGWGVGGIIGGMAIAWALWQIKGISIQPVHVFWGWAKAMLAGAIVYLVSYMVLLSLADSILMNLSSSHHYWWWSFIPEVLALCIAGAVIGSIGANQMFTKDEPSPPHTNDEYAHRQ